MDLDRAHRVVAHNRENNALPYMVISHLLWRAYKRLDVGSPPSPLRHHIGPRSRRTKDFYLAERVNVYLAT